MKSSPTDETNERGEHFWYTIFNFIIWKLKNPKYLEILIKGANQLENFAKFSFVFADLQKGYNVWLNALFSRFCFSGEQWHMKALLCIYLC